MHYIVRHAALLAVAVFLASCEQADAGSVTKALGGISQYAVYGKDDRREVYQYRGNTFARASQSLVALVRPYQIITGPAGEVSPNPTTAQELLQLCADEPFADQPAVASCSGVLIDDDLVLTAGHCFQEDEACDVFSYVFDYHYSREGQEAGITDLDVYGCKSLLVREKRELTNGTIRDFAVVQLDRKVDLRRRAAPFRTDAVVTNEEITVMGSPQGLPSKIDTGGVARPSPSPAFGIWFADTDTFAGSSGSPAYDAKLRLIGLLIQGQHDYEQDPELACQRASRFADEDLPKGELFAYLEPALSALCATAEGRRHDVCAPPPPVRGKVLQCSLHHRADGSEWLLWACGLLVVVAFLRR